MSIDDRRAARRGEPVRILRLGEEPDDDLSAVTTAEQRLEMVAQLSRRMWELTGRAVPAYTRGEIPIRIISRG